MNNFMKLTDNIQYPIIQSFMTAHKYLNCYYLYRKKNDSKFSYEIWAAELGFKSKSSMRMMCFGKRNISNLFINRFSKKNSLTEADKDYFYLLAQYQNTKISSLKKIYLDKIIEKCNAQSNFLEIKNYVQFLSSPSLPILQLIISFKDLKASEETLKKVTGLNLKTLASYLKILEDLGFITSFSNESEKTKIWTSRVQNFNIPDKFSDEALKMYHMNTADEAKSILNSQIESKKFKSLFVSLSEQDYKSFTEDVETFISRMMLKYANNFIKNKKLYKANFQVYPVTEKFD